MRHSIFKAALLFVLFLVQFVVFLSPARANPDAFGTINSTDTILNQMGKSATNNFGTLTTPQYGFQQFLNYPQTGNLYNRLRDFTLVKGLNLAVTGGVGISGVVYVPEVDLLFLVDNNALNISIYKASNLSAAEFGNVTFSGFTDTESLAYLWTIYDANGFPDSAVFAIAEESLNTIHLFQWDLQATSGTITKGTNTIDITPSNMWTLDGSFGMESLTYNPTLNVLYAAKQDASFEFRVIPLSGSLTPAATEPFDAEALWAATLPSPGGINDLAFDPQTQTCILIGDAQGATDSNQDIMRFNCQTGAILEHWNNFIDDLGFTAASWPQSEGIAISPDGQNLWISSEGDNVAWLQRNQSPFTQRTSVITQERIDIPVHLDVGADGATTPLRIINDVNGFGDSDLDDNTKTELKLEYYDSNELKSTQTESGRCILSAVTPPSALGAVQQESGGECELSTVVGTGTHGTNSRMLNFHAWNTGRLGVQQGTASTSRGTVWANVGGTIAFTHTQTGNGAGAETNLISTSVEGNTLDVNGSGLSIKGGGTIGAGVSADKRIRAYFGATTIFDTGALSLTTADWDLSCTIIRTGAATQKALCRFQSDNAGLTSDVDYSTPAETLSGAVTLRVTGAGTNASDVVGEFFKVFYEPEQ